MWSTARTQIKQHKEKLGAQVVLAGKLLEAMQTAIDDGVDKEELDIFKAPAIERLSIIEAILGQAWSAVSNGQEISVMVAGTLGLASGRCDQAGETENEHHR